MDNKVKIVTLRLTEDEYNTIKFRADELNLSISNFLRWTLQPYILQAHVKDSGVKVELSMPMKFNYNMKDGKKQLKLFNRAGRPRKEKSS